MEPTHIFALEDISSFLEKLAENSESVYWLSSPDFETIPYVSPAYERIWGRSREDLYRNPESWITYLHPEDSQRHHPINEMRERVALLGDAARYAEDYRIVRPNGEVRWIIDRGFPIIDKSGKCLGVTGVAVDITLEKVAEELRVSKELAEKKSQYLSVAAGSIAHDLRTPLSSIKHAIVGIESIFATLVEGYNLAVQHQLNVKPIRANKLALIETALERSQREIHFANTYIDLILSNLKYEQIDTYNYQVHNIVHVVNYALETYPCSTSEKALIHWDPNQGFDFWGSDFYLKNIINNLLKNSLFYIKQERRGEIFMWIEKGEEFNTLIYKEAALGASPEVLAHMFDGYFSTREGGTGLGMAFCKSMLESFGGDIQVESVAGEYIKFYLNFPVKHPIAE